MGVLKFRFHPPELATRLPDLKSAYVTGMDRTPSRGTVEVRPGLLTCYRETNESGRLHVSWPVEGFGVPVLATGTLAERAEAYDLGLELARGRLNEVRNQAADWILIGLEAPPQLDALLRQAQLSFNRAATHRDQPEVLAQATRETLRLSLEASEVLMTAYTQQVLQRRQEFSHRLPTLLGCSLQGLPRKPGACSPIASVLNAGRISCTWAQLAPHEGRFRWEDFDAQLAWCKAAGLTPTAGPILELSPSALPDWIWLWENDFDEIQSMVEDLIRQTISRYRGKIAVWHLAHRAGTGEILGLSEEEQLRLVARALQVARQQDGNTQFVIDFERPWAGWLASSHFQLGPLHTADSLARADLGMGGIGLELAPGYSPPGSHWRDLLDFSRLLDLFALINLPLHVTLVLPSSASPDPGADPSISVATSQWPAPPDEEQQRDWAARWISLATAKPFVRSVTWLQATDAAPHRFPHGGLLRNDQTPKPIVEWLGRFRAQYLE